MATKNRFGNKKIRREQREKNIYWDRYIEARMVVMSLIFLNRGAV